MHLFPSPVFFLIHACVFSNKRNTCERCQISSQQRKSAVIFHVNDYTSVLCVSLSILGHSFLSSFYFNLYASLYLSFTSLSILLCSHISYLSPLPPSLSLSLSPSSSLSHALILKICIFQTGNQRQQTFTFALKYA